jgi:hypothetical protein
VKGSATVEGPNGHRSNGSEIEGRPDTRLETRVPDGGARRGPDGVAKRGAQPGWPNGVPDGAKRGARRGQTECPTGPDGVPNRAGRGARRVARRVAKQGG